MWALCGSWQSSNLAYTPIDDKLSYGREHRFTMIMHVSNKKHCQLNWAFNDEVGLFFMMKLSTSLNHINIAKLCSLSSSAWPNLQLRLTTHNDKY